VLKIYHSGKKLAVSSEKSRSVWRFFINKIFGTLFATRFGAKKAACASAIKSVACGLLKVLAKAACATRCFY